MNRVIVIGGGPAGMMAAGTAASFGCSVILIEKNRILGKKLLITGKGRCNVTNFCDVENVLKNVNSSNPKFLYSSLYEFNCYDTYSFFEEKGVQLKIERGNRVFPSSDKAVDVRNALIDYLKDNKVEVVNETVRNIDFKDFKVITDSSNYKADKIIIATGGLSYSSTGSTGDGYKFAKKAGHTVTPLNPALVALKGDTEVCCSLTGLSLKNVSIEILDSSQKSIYSDFGEMLFTHTGVSGPIILSASSKLDFNRNKYTLLIDFKPALSHEQLDARIIKDFEKYSNKDFINSLSDLLPKKLIPIIVNKSGIDSHKKVNNITRECRKNLVNLIKNFKIDLFGKEGYDQAIITSGGISTLQVNPKTMESLTVKGLYFAGEVLDIDANTGGYNLQIAFSTGFLAGKSCSGGKNGN